MELYLIRHGIAQERAIALTDEERSLTKIGQDKTKQVAQRLNSLGLRFEAILTSPLARSYQTAEIFAAMQLTGKLQITPELAPNGSIHAWLHGLEQQPYPPSSKLALVGHQPDLGQWASILVWGEFRQGLILKKAGIIGLKLPPTGSPLGRSQMFWLTPPKFLLV